MEKEGLGKTTFVVRTDFNDEKCEFKRGGYCLRHKIRGSKSISTSQVMIQKKDGMYGWVTRRKTIYRCEMEPTKRLHQSPTDCEVKKNYISTQGLEKRTTNVGITSERISGVGLTWAGANLDRNDHN